MVDWGRKIPDTGVKPVWLADDQWIAVGVCEYRAADAKWFAGSLPFRLPADHFAYAALDAGFEPWGGGDAAPGDWDGGNVLLRNGDRECHIVWWKHHADGTRNSIADVIGYRKRVAPTTLVTVPQMTETEARRRWHPAETRIVILRDLNLIRPETPIERFEAANPGVVNTGNRAAVEAALAWERGL